MKIKLQREHTHTHTQIGSGTISLPQQKRQSRVENNHLKVVQWQLNG